MSTSLNLHYNYSRFNKGDVYGNPNVTKLSKFKLSFKVVNSRVQKVKAANSRVQKVKAVNSRVQKVKARNSRVQKVKAVNSKVQKYRGQIYQCVHMTTIIKYLWDNKLVVK